MNPIIKEDLANIAASPLVDWSRFYGKTVFVTGCYGMIASYLVYQLIYLNEFVPGANIRIIGVGRSRGKAFARFGKYLEKEYFTFIEGDVCSPVAIDKRIDFIIHAASPASPQYYGVNPVGVLLPNIFGTYQVLELCRRHEVEGCLFLSSGAVYGDVSGKERVTETDYGYLDILNIASCYPESKRMGEVMCGAWKHQYGVPVKIARPYHIYGPTMDIERDQRVFAEFTADVVAGRDIVMKSDGSKKRPFCYLGDAATALFKILLDGVPGEAYNVCNSESFISIRKLAEIIASIYPGKGLRVVMQERNPDEGYVEDVKVQENAPDDGKIRCLGWTPEYNVFDGFKRTIDSFFKNE